MRKSRVAGTMLVGLAIVIAGCGSSGKSSSGTAAASAGGGYANPSPVRTAGPSAPPSTPAALITTKHDKLGTIVSVGPKKLTAYLFEADKGSTSNCMGECARVWPPVTGTPQAHGGARPSELSTIARPDGSRQVTYKGHPLYLYAKDKDDGDTYGQGIKSFGAAWYALRPSGVKADLS